MSEKLPFYKQLDAMDCGPTCLRMVAKHYGKHYSLETLRQKSFIGRERVSMLGISTDAESIGIRTIGVHISFLQLAEVSPPCNSLSRNCSLAKQRHTATISNCINSYEAFPTTQHHSQPLLVGEEQLHWVMLRHGVQLTGGGAGKERCPSRGIALMFNGPHSDVPCLQAP